MIKDTTSWGWNTLPLEIRQQIMTEVLNEAMRDKTPNFPHNNTQLCDTLIATSHRLGQNDLLQPLTQLSNRIDQTIQELNAALETMQREATSHVLAIKGVIVPEHSTDVFRVGGGHWCSTCSLIFDVAMLELDIRRALFRVKGCQAWVRYGLGVLNAYHKYRTDISAWKEKRRQVSSKTKEV